MATTQKRTLFTIESIVGRSPSPPYPLPASPQLTTHPTSGSKVKVPSSTPQEVPVFAGAHQHGGFYPLPPYEDALLAAALLGPYFRKRAMFSSEGITQAVRGRSPIERVGPGSQRVMFRCFDGAAVVKNFVWRNASGSELLPWTNPFLRRLDLDDAMNGARILGGGRIASSADDVDDLTSTFSHFHGYRKPKRIRTAFSPNQLVRLEEAFDGNQYVVGQERKDLATSLCLSETQVKVWFQNRRTKHKRGKNDEEIDGTAQREAARPVEEPTEGGQQNSHGQDTASHVAMVSEDIFSSSANSLSSFVGEQTSSSPHHVTSNEELFNFAQSVRACASASPTNHDEPSIGGLILKRCKPSHHVSR